MSFKFVEMALFPKFFYRKPPDGLLEIYDRVCTWNRKQRRFVFVQAFIINDASKTTRQVIMVIYHPSLLKLGSTDTLTSLLVQYNRHRKGDY
ncbi:hypothetical protein LWI28_010532 [Acer negundo]|uniref:Uncharacterized protein n=1 Tax=Acer negundo TaxID=4023 RepID=A0AAD5J8X9_ACENE|nr:hypothetical protein LWI28_010532 [Acer negundo]